MGARIILRGYEGREEGRKGKGGGTCLPITPMHAIEGGFDWGDGVGM